MSTPPLARTRRGPFARLLLLLEAAVAGLFLTAPAQAQTIITSDTVIDYSAGDVVVQAAENGVSPTVTVVDGGSIGRLTTLDEGVVHFTGGNFNDLDSFDASTVIVAAITPGSIDEDINTFGTSAFHFFGGELEEDLIAHDSSTVNIFFGARIDEGAPLITAPMEARDSSTINFFGGTVDERDLEAFGVGTVRLFGNSDFQGGV